jgi:REP element-mobilizing transposase RayT
MRTVRRSDFEPFDWAGIDSIHRKHLPHVEQSGAIYFVTFRLADSLPQKQLKQWRADRSAWMAFHPEPWTEDEAMEYRREFTARIEKWLDAGSGECVLRNENCRSALEITMKHAHCAECDLGDWVIMPNHVHLLIQPLGSSCLSEILKGIKGVSARRINQCLGRTGRVWMDESFDHIVRSLEQLEKLQTYVERNPMKARLRMGEFSYERRWTVEE